MESHGCTFPGPPCRTIPTHAREHAKEERALFVLVCGERPACSPSRRKICLHVLGYRLVWRDAIVAISTVNSSRRLAASSPFPICIYTMLVLDIMHAILSYISMYAAVSYGMHSIPH
jgi:hypothetical protein